MSRRFSHQGRGAVLAGSHRKPSTTVAMVSSHEASASAAPDLGSFEYVEGLLARQKQDHPPGSGRRGRHRLTLELTPAQHAILSQVAMSYVHGPTSEVLAFYLLREFCVRTLCAGSGIKEQEAYARFDAGVQGEGSRTGKEDARP